MVVVSGELPGCWAKTCDLGRGPWEDRRQMAGRAHGCAVAVRKCACGSLLEEAVVGGRSRRSAERRLQAAAAAACSRAAF